MKFIRNLFLTNRFFYVMAAFITVMMLSYAFPFLLALVETGCILFLVVLGIDVILLYNRGVNMSVQREMPGVLSLGDDNIIRITLSNKSNIRLWVDLLDELPEQFQVRNFLFHFALMPGKSFEKNYTLRPLTRGEYSFGQIHLYLTNTLGFIRRRISYPLQTEVSVYPSIIQMKKYELKTFAVRQQNTA